MNLFTTRYHLQPSQAVAQTIKILNLCIKKIPESFIKMGMKISDVSHLVFVHWIQSSGLHIKEMYHRTMPIVMPIVMQLINNSK